jgi:hypothetical protein
MRCHTLNVLDVHICAALAICSAAPLEILGVDWGLDCLQRRLDWCNGENTGSSLLHLPKQKCDTLTDTTLMTPVRLLRSCYAVAHEPTYVVFC